MSEIFDVLKVVVAVLPVHCWITPTQNLPNMLPCAVVESVTGEPVVNGPWGAAFTSTVQLTTFARGRDESLSLCWDCCNTVVRAGQVYTPTDYGSISYVNVTQIPSDKGLALPSDIYQAQCVLRITGRGIERTLLE